MAEFPSLPLWTDAYLADTRHLSTLEHGAYLLLMMEAWRRPTCSLPNDERMLARLAGLSMDEWEAIRGTILPLFVLEKRTNTYTQKRLKKEHEYLQEKRVKNRNASLRRWKETEKDDANAMQTDMHKASQPTPTPTPIKKEPKGSKKGTRIPADWMPDFVEAEKVGLSKADAMREAERFRDYWSAASGAKATKLDWLATWRNWCRNVVDRRRPQGQFNSKQQEIARSFEERAGNDERDYDNEQPSFDLARSDFRRN